MKCSVLMSTILDQMRCLFFYPIRPNNVYVIVINFRKGNYLAANIIHTRSHLNLTNVLGTFVYIHIMFYV